MPQPKSGRITRSPRAVPRMIMIAWRMSASYSAAATPPVTGSKITGHAHPRPSQSFCSFIAYSSSDEHRWLTGGNRIRAAGLDDNVTLTRGGQTPDEDGHASHKHCTAHVRLQDIHQRARMKVGGGAPCRHSFDEDGWASGARSQWRSVASCVGNSRGW